MAEILITRTYGAPREKVWEAWTNPTELKKWWGPKGYTCTVAEIDARVGGKFFSDMVGPDGKAIYGIWEYQEVVPNERFVVSDNFTDEHGNLVPPSYYGMPGDELLNNTIAVTLEEADGKTKMTIKHTTSDPDTQAEAGWKEMLDKLDAYLETN